MSVEPEQDRVAARVIGELERGAELVDEGHFTLDREKALEKLADYRLAHPLAWVLLMVRIGHIGRSASIEIDIDDESSEVVLGGVTLPEACLVDPFAVLFRGRERGDADVERGRTQHLFAIVYADLLSLEPKSIEITTVDERGQGIRLRHERGASSETIERGVFEGLGEPQTSIWVVFGTSRRGADKPWQRTTSWLARRQLEQEESERDIAFLRSRCAYFMGSIQLDGDPIERGKWFAEHDERTKIVDEQGRELGVAGWCGSDPSAVVLLVDGVVIETLHVQELPPGSFAVVDADELHLDLSQSKIIRDERFEALLERVREAFERLPSRAKEPERAGQRRVQRTGIKVVAAGLGVFGLVLVSSGQDTLAALGFLCFLVGFWLTLTASSSGSDE